MHSSFPVDAGILLGAALVIVGIVVSAVADRYRLPGLVLFLFLGMAVADDGLGLVHFANASVAQNVAVVALIIILFEGGWQPRRQRFAVPVFPRPCWRPSAWPGAGDWVRFHPRNSWSGRLSGPSGDRNFF